MLSISKIIALLYLSSSVFGIPAPTENEAVFNATAFFDSVLNYYSPDFINHNASENVGWVQGYATPQIVE
jgi:hypothetical protein